MRVYLDHNATSPLLPEVLEAMTPWLGGPANPSSAHREGQRAAAALEQAREHVAALVGGRPEGVVFTSGATEANHLFVRGHARRTERRTWVLGAIEHPCVHAAVEALGPDWTARRLPVDRSGRCTIGELDEQAAALSLMAANHETGVLQDLERALAATEAVGAALHVDATQAAGRVPLDLGRAAGVTLSGHKLGGPPGIGALVLPDGEPFPPLFAGSQERNRRGGTTPVALAVGLGRAAFMAAKEMGERRQKWQDLMHHLRSGLARLGAREIGDEPRVPQTLCVVFPGVAGEGLVQALDLAGIAASSGAACASGSLEASPVLTAMGDPEPDGALRVSLGPGTTRSDIDALLARLPAIVLAFGVEP